MGLVGSHNSRVRRILIALCGVSLVATLGAAGGTGASGTTFGAESTDSSGVPLPPVSVTVAQDGVGPDLKASWIFSSTGAAATGAIVQLYDGSTYVSKIICGHSCLSVIFRSLTFGTKYTVLVRATNASGTGTAMTSTAVAPTTTCTVGACVTFDASDSIGTADHAVTGILNSVYPGGSDQADMTALDSTMFRGSPSYNANGTLNWSTWNVALATGAQTTLMLSSLWKNYNNGTPPTPWSDWSAYTSWVTATVKTVVTSGEQVNYWEVYNEPGSNNGYYSSANFATVTPALLEQQFLMTYQAIMAADASAAIIGPSLQHWSDYPGEYTQAGSPAKQFDMVTFLDFANTNNLKLAAISWHEIDDTLGPNPSENTLLPANIEDHVAEARTLIANLANIGNPLIFINEYAMPELQPIPGWDVAYLSALTDAGVSYAGRACWSGACSEPSLDSLLDSSGDSPEPSYWDRTVYAAMSGNMIETTSNNDNVTALGSYNTATKTVTGLVGRAIGCNQSQSQPACTTTFPNSKMQLPAEVTVKITVPWTTGTAEMSLSDIPGEEITPIPEPTPTASDVAVTPNGTGMGTCTITIPSFADGDAYGFTITNGT